MSGPALSVGVYLRKSSKGKSMLKDYLAKILKRNKVLLTVNEAAKRLGKSNKTIYNWIAKGPKRGGIRAKNIGTRLFIPEDEVERLRK